MSIVRINQFQAAAGKEDELFHFLKSLNSYITSSKGCLSYEVLQNIDDAADFTVIEKWESVEAHQDSVSNFPQEDMEAAMSLFGGAPSGQYYTSGGSNA
ncbi:putative quinol monooxygenase [Gimesia panareensis]|uniref:putative quinol monooxygenase n=1 Tax=Gimesia panareensis TaxID=2527978 RepID=UPI001188A51D|nr:antibiotic biosynthesis monooxygenase family protein [Gimesia panareensis]QDU47937.1 Antibiotic biosynthesis monooxygenase [Gimesia panareensis]